MVKAAVIGVMAVGIASAAVLFGAAVLLCARLSYEDQLLD